MNHVEHLQFEFTSGRRNSEATSRKEYVYGQFVVLDGKLYFSERCLVNHEIMQSPMLSSIYNALDSEGAVFDEGMNLKGLDDNNIDFVIDSILSSCPQVSRSYMDIVEGMVSRANNK